MKFTVCPSGRIDCEDDKCGEWHHGGHDLESGLEPGSTIYISSSINDDIDIYFAAKAAVHQSFGYLYNWIEMPMDDARDQYWMLVGSESDGTVVHSPQPLTVESIASGEAIYYGYIYTQRFLTKWVCRGATHVMISVDSGCDDNKFLMIFDASKECIDEKIKEAWTTFC